MALTEGYKSIENRLLDYPELLVAVDVQKILGIGRDKSREFLLNNGFSIGKKNYITKQELIRWLSAKSR